MLKTLAPSVTARDPKGLKFISVVEAAYNKAGLSDEEAQRVNDTPGLADLVAGFIAENRNANQLLLTWQSFYRDVFGLEIDFSRLKIPVKQPGFNRLLVMSQGMTPERLFRKCKKLFLSWKWTEQSLDGIVVSDRTAKDGPYAIWVRDRVEADEELKNLSANDLKEKGIPCITLEERLLFELKFFRKTGRHLDVANVTLCSGSHYSDGRLPDVDWSGGGMRVDCYYPGLVSDDLRARQVVS